MASLRSLALAAAAAGCLGAVGCSGSTAPLAPVASGLSAAREPPAAAAHVPFQFGPDVVRAAAATRVARSLAPVPPLCTELTFTFPGRGTVTMSAAVVGPVSNAKIDASGCDIGIFLDSSANGATVAGDTIVDANQFGVLAIGTQKLNLAQLAISRIGNHDADGAYDPNGVQTGVGLYFEGVNARVSGATIAQYQKNGTAFNGGSTVALSQSTATGAGTVDYIAQNGFQFYNSNVGRSFQSTAKANVYNNPADPVYDHQATGFLLLCTNLSNPTQAQNFRRTNYAVNNDYNFYISNASSDGC